LRPFFFPGVTVKLACKGATEKRKKSATAIYFCFVTQGMPNADQFIINPPSSLEPAEK